jgi:hypothetical protein
MLRKISSENSWIAGFSDRLHKKSGKQIDEDLDNKKSNLNAKQAKKGKE